ncbi:MAG: tetratricopeptide repeat protein [Thermocladium sp.]
MQAADKTNGKPRPLGRGGGQYQNNAVFLFEYANALDFLGEEDEAVPLYRRALAMGLSGEIKAQAEIQLGSSLSIIGEDSSAVEILDRVYRETNDPAALAFLCIALYRSGEIKKALKTALGFIISSEQGLLPEYKRVLSQYLNEVT